MNRDICPACSQRFYSARKVSAGQFDIEGIPWYKYVRPSYYCDRCGCKLNQKYSHALILWIMVSVFFGAAVYCMLFYREFFRDNFVFGFIFFTLLSSFLSWHFRYYELAENSRET